MFAPWGKLAMVNGTLPSTTGCRARGVYEAAAAWLPSRGEGAACNCSCPPAPPPGGEALPRGVVRAGSTWTVTSRPCGTSMTSCAPTDSASTNTLAGGFFAGGDAPSCGTNARLSASASGAALPRTTTARAAPALRVGEAVAATSVSELCAAAPRATSVPVSAARVGDAFATGLRFTARAPRPDGGDSTFSSVTVRWRIAGGGRRWVGEDSLDAGSSAPGGAAGASCAGIGWGAG